MSQRDTKASERGTTAVQSVEHIKKQIAESEGFPIGKIDEFVVFIQNDPYITSAGLQYKMLQTYKAGKFAVQGCNAYQRRIRFIAANDGIKR